jgi:hypothetical protein
MKIFFLFFLLMAGVAQATNIIATTTLKVKGGPIANFVHWQDTVFTQVQKGDYLEFTVTAAAPKKELPQRDITTMHSSVKDRQKWAEEHTSPDGVFHLAGNTWVGTVKQLFHEPDGSWEWKEQEVYYEKGDAPWEHAHTNETPNSLQWRIVDPTHISHGPYECEVGRNEVKVSGTLQVSPAAGADLTVTIKATRIMD